MATFMETLLKGLRWEKVNGTGLLLSLASLASRLEQPSEPLIAYGGVSAEGPGVRHDLLITCPAELSRWTVPDSSPLGTACQQAAEPRRQQRQPDSGAHPTPYRGHNKLQTDGNLLLTDLSVRSAVPFGLLVSVKIRELVFCSQMLAELFGAPRVTSAQWSHGLPLDSSMEW